MTLTPRLAIGTRVRQTARWLEASGARKAARGTVVGYGREPHKIRVLRDGRVTADRWHEDFWEPLVEGTDCPHAD